MQKWTVVRLEIVGPTREVLANRLFEIGALGLEERDRELLAYFEAESWNSCRPGFEQYCAAINAKLEVMDSALAEQDWAENWKEFFRPGPVGEKFFLLPIWEKEQTVPAGRAPILVDPGQAFGTGFHESTALSIRMLEAQACDWKQCSILDVGCGTGILAVVAHRLGCRNVTAIDNDAIAVEVARENLLLNRCAEVELCIGTIVQVPKTFDRIVANILLSVHLEQMGEYASKLKPGGALILSGILDSQVSEIEASAASHQLRQCAKECENGWVCLSFYRST